MANESREMRQINEVWR